MLLIHSGDYNKFKEIVGNLHGVSTWYSLSVSNKFVSMGTKSGLPVAVLMTPTAMPETFNSDFPDAINVGEIVGSFVIDGS